MAFSPAASGGFALAFAAAVATVPGASSAYQLTGGCILKLEENAIKMADMKSVENTSAFIRYASADATTEITVAKNKKLRKAGRARLEQITLSFTIIARPDGPLNPGSPGRRNALWVLKADSGRLISFVSPADAVGQPRISIFNNAKRGDWRFKGAWRSSRPQLTWHFKSKRGNFCRF